MMSNLPYLDFSNYLREQFPNYKVQKISLNAGCTCPNRDGSKGMGGCIYCNNTSFTPEYTLSLPSIEKQLEAGIEFFRRKYKEMKFLGYFQSYTNTYGKIDELIKKYETVVSHPEVVGLIVGTRPDCMPVELLNYFQDLKERRNIFVYIEYGVESVDDKILKRINRGHTFEESRKAIIETTNRGIDVGGHFILGLPGDSDESILRSAEIISELPLNSIKLHQLQILRGTVLGAQYLKDPSRFSTYTLEEYIALVANFVTLLRPDLYIDRFVSQSPEVLLIAPRWGVKNYIFTHKLISFMQNHNLFQGKNYSNK